MAWWLKGGVLLQGRFKSSKFEAPREYEAEELEEELSPLVSDSFR